MGKDPLFTAAICASLHEHILAAAPLLEHTPAQACLPPGSGLGHGPDSAAVLEKCRRRLRENGQTVTRSAVGVLALLSLGGDPLTHGELAISYEQLFGEQIDRVTLYRILKRLTTSGLGRCTTGIDRITRYADASSSPNSSFECLVCHRVHGLSQDQGLQRAVDRAIERLEEDGIYVTQTAVALRGVCARCSAPPLMAGIPFTPGDTHRNLEPL